MGGRADPAKRQARCVESAGYWYFSCTAVSRGKNLQAPHDFKQAASCCVVSDPRHCMAGCCQVDQLPGGKEILFICNSMGDSRSDWEGEGCGGRMTPCHVSKNAAKQRSNVWGR